MKQNIIAACVAATASALELADPKYNGLFEVVDKHHYTKKDDVSAFEIALVGELA